MFESFVSPCCRRRCGCGRSGRRRAGRSCGCVLLADLQGTDVSDYRPTILYRNLCSVGRHRAPAVCDCVKEVSDRRLPQSIVVERGGAAEAPAHDHAVAVAGPAMTNAAEYVVTFAAAHHDFFGDWKRKSSEIVGISVGIRLRACDWLCSGRRRGRGRSGSLSGEEFGIGAKKATRDRAFDWRPAGKPVTEKCCSAKRLHLRLVLHIATATGKQEQEQYAGAGKPVVPAPAPACSRLLPLLLSFSLRHHAPVPAPAPACCPCSCLSAFDIMLQSQRLLLPAAPAPAFSAFDIKCSCRLPLLPSFQPRHQVLLPVPACCCFFRFRHH
jgi:hypothetical protein